VLVHLSWRRLAGWLYARRRTHPMTGYYSAKRNNTTFDLQEFREASKKVMDYCQNNLKTTVMDAAEKVLGVKR
jgi:hypothetical protein